MINQESFYGAHELEAIRPLFGHIGKNVKISRYARFYNTPNISIEDNSRIDDFAILSAGEAGIKIGKWVHIASFCFLAGRSVITIGDFSGLSVRCSVFSSSDSYDGEFLTNPCLPDEYRKVINNPVCIDEGVVVGAHTVVLPGSFLHKGSAIGANSLVNSHTFPHMIYAGTPIKQIGERSHREAVLRKDLWDKYADQRNKKFTNTSE